MSRVVRRYVWFQVPGFVVVGLVAYSACHYFAWPMWVVGAALGGHLLKDVLLFPFVKNAYDDASAAPREQMTGAEATARESLSPTGYVYVGGELWKARVEGGESVPAGARLSVVRVEDALTVVVRPAS